MIAVTNWWVADDHATEDQEHACYNDEFKAVTLHDVVPY